MISFANLGKFDRFGNQLFQYAFLRTTAQRLGVKFYCPRWLGDTIFQLNDEAQRAFECVNINKIYLQPYKNTGFNESDLRIEDGTDIYGFFQSPRLFDQKQARRWYTFKPEVTAAVKEKYRHVDFSKTTGLHLRFGDMRGNIMFVIAPQRYYAEALTRVKHKETVLVFSDEIDAAREHLGAVGKNLTYIQGNRDYEDLFLLTQCRDIVCSVSTFSWWAAWLNSYPDKTIVTTREWIRPGHTLKSLDLCCAGWTHLRTCRQVLDDFRLLKFKKIWKGRLDKIRSRSLRENVFSLGNVIRNRFKGLVRRPFLD